MEHSVQLGTQYYRESICARLLELRDREKLPFRIIEHKQGKRWIIKCQFLDHSLEATENEGMVQKIHRYYLANALAETILHNWGSTSPRPKVSGIKRKPLDDLPSTFSDPSRTAECGQPKRKTSEDEFRKPCSIQTFY